MDDDVKKIKCLHCGTFNLVSIKRLKDGNTPICGQCKNKLTSIELPHAPLTYKIAASANPVFPNEINEDIKIDKLKKPEYFLKKPRNTLSIFAIILLSLFIIGWGIQVVKTMPEYANVYVDHEKKVYYAPTYIREMRYKNNNNISFHRLKLTTAKKASNLGYEPDYDCREKEYFVDGDKNIITDYLEEIGVIKKVSRWNKDGSWNW